MLSKQLTLSNELKRLILFFFVGGVNTLFGYSLYALLLFLHLHYALASLLGTVGGVLFNFKTTGIIVFKNNENHLIFKFVGVYFVTYLVNLTCLMIFKTYGVNMYMAGALLVIPVASLSYILLKKFVFGREKKDETGQRGNPLLQRGR